ncbi:unnamed protein product [Effrenium voratum]|uniref:Uncharacterized protein n=1 Tax=Effrenium voratum TaxID=2562239 RepID=A0AA36J1B5_9DINO|nr:unnamed protein product [Effrenium voratum]
MVDIKHPRCNCGRARPCFGMPEDARASCCAKCKLEGMVDIINPRCNCGRAIPSFGMPKDARASCCAKCKLEGMVDIINPRCNCGRAQPAFGMPEDARPSCCAECKLQGMVDIKNLRCNCGRAIPCFGMPDNARASCCSKCKLEGMVDIKSRRCNCGRAIPCFGMPEDARASCCAKCKLEGMVDIKNPRCNCGRAQPAFGMPEDARASCCAECKLEDMVDIISRKCNCGRARPYFGMPKDARPSCCAKCKLEGMVDIKNPKCSVCGKHAKYPDAAGKPRQLCAAHSAEVGAHVLSSPCWSRAASECLDLLEEERGFKFLYRQRFDEAAGAWSGEEFAGLVADRALRPDAYDPPRREVVEFLGNYYHGFPPKHPEHLSFTCVGGKTSAELHRETFKRLDLFLEQNMRVFYVWEHEFTEWQKLAATGEAPPISRILRRHTYQERREEGSCKAEAARCKLKQASLHEDLKGSREGSHRRLEYASKKSTSSRLEG